MKNTTKKITSILLVLTIVLSCFAFVGCAWTEFINPTNNTSSSTTKKKPYAKDVEINNGMGFTEQDKDFVKFMYDRGVLSTPPYIEFVYTFGDFVERNVIRNNDASFYRVDINLNQKPYFIAAYSPDSVESGLTPVFSLKEGWLGNITWHKFYDYDTIPDKIDDLVLRGVYAMYECTIQRDVMNNKEYNISATYFIPLTDGYSDAIADMNFLYGLTDSVLWYAEKQEIENHYPLFVQARINVAYTYCDYKDMFGLYVDGSGVEYVMFDYCISVEEKNEFGLEKFQYELDSLYDEMAPYMIRNESLDQYSSDDQYSNMIYYIKLSDLLNIISILSE